MFVSIFFIAKYSIGRRCLVHLEALICEGEQRIPGVSSPDLRLLKNLFGKPRSDLSGFAKTIRGEKPDTGQPWIWANVATLLLFMT